MESCGNKRETFNNKIDFLIACVGYSVGLGNFWRFPYPCYKNGGGAFLLPYFIMVTLAGIPMFFLEVSIGQFMSSGGIKVWNISPIFTGIGFATTLIVFFLNVYYNVIMSWAFFYLFSSFTAKVPWSHCGNEWNTFRCRSVWGNDATNSSLSNFTSIGANISSSLLSNMSMASLGSGNGTSQQPDYYVDSTTEFWQ